MGGKLKSSAAMKEFAHITKEGGANWVCGCHSTGIHRCGRLAMAFVSPQSQPAKVLSPFKGSSPVLLADLNSHLPMWSPPVGLDSETLTSFSFSFSSFCLTCSMWNFPGQGLKGVTAATTLDLYFTVSQWNS